MTAGVATARPGADLGRGVVALLALAVFINYVDRGNLATAAPLIRDELKLSNTQFGLLVSAFFWSYVPGQLVAGWLAERINAARTLAIGLALWSLATVATGFAGGFAAIITLRLLLGLGESAAFPCSSRLLAQHLPAHRLGGPNGLISSGVALGPAFGTFVGGSLMALAGWRAAFLAFGLVSLLWLAPWLMASRAVSAAADQPSPEVAPSFAAILGRREAWGASLGHFGANYAFYFVVTWLPLYLVKAHGFSLVQMAQLGGVIYVVYAASCLSTGRLADRWMAAGASDTRVRKGFLIAGHLGAAVCMLACAVGGASGAIVGLVLAGVFFGFTTPNVYAVGQTLAGPRAAGKWISLQNCLGNLAGIVGPVITGFVVDRTGSFDYAFLLAGAVSVAGVLGWAVVIGKVAPLEWRTEPA